MTEAPHLAEHQIVDLLRQIERHQAQVTNIIHQIEGCDHPAAAALADDLWQQCWFAASAEYVGSRYLSQQWALEVLPSGHLGGLVSIKWAQAHGKETHKS